MRQVDAVPKLGTCTGAADTELSERLRILHVIDSGGLYGAEKVLLSLAVETVKRGHHVCVGTIVAPQDEQDAVGCAARDFGLNHVTFEMTDGLNWRGLADILRFAREERTDLIHSHGYKANTLLALSPRRWRPCAIACTLHGWTATSSLTKIAVYEYLERKIIRRLDRVVAVSDSILRRVARGHDGFSVKIPNGVDVATAYVPSRGGGSTRNAGGPGQGTRSWALELRERI